MSKPHEILQILSNHYQQMNCDSVNECFNSLNKQRKFDIDGLPNVLIIGSRGSCKTTLERDRLFQVVNNIRKQAIKDYIEQLVEQYAVGRDTDRTEIYISEYDLIKIMVEMVGDEQ